MPALIGGFGNFLLPLMVGGPDMAKEKNVLPRFIKWPLNYSLLQLKKDYKIDLGLIFAGLFLGVNFKVVTRNTKQYCSLQAKNRSSFIVLNYFNTYPLFSSKY